MHWSPPQHTALSFVRAIYSTVRETVAHISEGNKRIDILYVVCSNKDARINTHIPSSSRDNSVNSDSYGWIYVTELREYVTVTWPPDSVNSD